MKILLLFISLLVGNSCSRTISRTELTEYVLKPENGVISEYYESGIKWKSYLLPTDILVSNEINRPSFKGILSDARKKYEDQIYFTVAISFDGMELSLANSKNKDLPMLREILRKLENSIRIENSSGEAFSPLYVFSPSTYGLAPETKITAGFDARALDGSEWLNLLVSSSEIGTGVEIFKFRTKDITRVPRLKFS